MAGVYKRSRRDRSGIPCIFPSNQGNWHFRDEFARDCLLQRRVNCELGTGATSLAGGRPAVDETKSGFVFASKAERTKLPHLPIGAEVNVTGRAAAGLLELAEMQREAELLYVRECWVAL